MAFVFPNREDVFKSKAYEKAYDEGLRGRDYFNRARQIYENIVINVKKYNGVSLEERLTELAIRWKEAEPQDRKKIDHNAVRLLMGCFSLGRQFRSVAKEYYRTYWRIKKQDAFYVL